MKNSASPHQKLYWKEALRHMQQEVETDPGDRRWSLAYKQAQADLADPGAVVWLPDEIVELIGQAQAAKEPEPEAGRAGFRLPLIGLILSAGVGLSILSFLRAYRRLRP